jgi:serine/threonine protein kinase
VSHSRDPRPADEQEWELLHEIADRLEQAWDHSDTIDLRQFVQGVEDLRLRLLALHELIKTDLEIRWRRRKDRFLEDYARALPELGPLSALPAELIFEEYRARTLYGDKPKPESYRTRFPGQFDAFQAAIRGNPFATQAEPVPPTKTESKPPPPPAPSPPRREKGREGTATDATAKPPSARDRPASRPRGNGASSSGSGLGSFVNMDSGYELIEPLGRGNFGEVWKARAPGGVLVALKRIFRTLDDRASRQEQKALELICNLRHPYLLQTHWFSPEQDRLVIIMELADGSLSDWLKEHQQAGRQGIPVEELLPYFAQAAEGLDFLHSRNVMHRDIKPGNLLRLGGYAKVADFGLAREQYETMEAATFFAGTPLYMPPEMWANQVHINSDQFALASAYVEVRRGKRCFTAKTPAEIQKQILQGKPDLTGLPPPEQQVLLRAMAVKPEQRYPNCAAFVRALKDAVLPPPPQKSSRPSKGLVAALGFGLLAVLVLLCYFLTPPPPPPPPPVKVDWLPEGWEPVADSKVVTDHNNRRYWQFIKRKVGDEEVVLVAIRQKGSGGPRTFYMMQDKVWNDLFRARMEQDDAKKKVQYYLRFHGYKEAFANELGSWKLGAFAPEQGDKDDKAPIDLGIAGKRGVMPVMRVTLLEAFVFADLLGGRLPQKKQYLKAAGFDESEGAGVGPFQGDPDDPKDLGLGLGNFGPLPVRPPRARSESVFHVRDLGGNGFEWSRSLSGDRGEVPVREIFVMPKVVVVGQGYLNERPWTFETERAVPDNLRFYNEVYAEIGFRIVIDREESR